MKQHVVSPTNRGDLRDGLKRANFVVGQHDRDQRGLRTYNFVELIEIDTA